MFYMVLTLSLIVIFIWNIFIKRRNLDHIPGPNEHPIWHILFKTLDPHKTHLNLAAQARKYGPVMRVKRLNMEPMVIVSDFYSIYKVLVTSGKEFGGRPTDNYRVNSLFANTGMVGNTYPDEKWKLLRKITHRHLRQFGDGLPHLEAVISDITKMMMSKFQRECGKPIDPSNIIFDAAFETIMYLITGKAYPSDHPIITRTKEFQFRVLQLLSFDAPLSVQVLQYFPWLRFLGWPGYKIIQRHNEVEDEIWSMLISEDSQDSMVTLLNEFVSPENNPTGGKITVTDARKTAMNLLFAGVATTQATFHAAINILAHNSEVQNKMFEEIDKCIGKLNVCHSDRSNLPYTRASLLELLRYTSTVAVGSIHRTCFDVMLDNYHIPEGTSVMTNLWYLHWDPEFWGDPEVFRPERFLDDGELLPPDHPFRKHLMPFGAGTRVCIGEALATTRLFLWIVSLIQNFSIIPGEEDGKWKSDPRNFVFESIMLPVSYKVIFQIRE